MVLYNLSVLVLLPPLILIKIYPGLLKAFLKKHSVSAFKSAHRWITDI